jgi:hypothetical protein
VAKSERLAAFGKALDTALGTSRSRGWLGAEVARDLGEDTPITASAVTQWINGDTEPKPPERVFAIERVVGVRPGTLSRLLGYLPLDAKPVRSVIEAIDADTNLSEPMRAVLREAYRAAAKGST